MSDAIKKPPHYARWKIQPAYFIMENRLPFDVGNIIKYVCRYDAKNGVEDLRKAAQYLLMMLERAEGKANYVPGQEVPGEGPRVLGSPERGALPRDGRDGAPRRTGVRGGSPSAQRQRGRGAKARR